MFNALKYTKNLEDNGFEREQAETLVSMFMQMIEFNMVSKSDFENFKIEVRHGFEQIEKSFNHKLGQINQRFEQVDQRFEQVEQRFDKVEEKIDQKIDKLALQLTVKLGVMLAVSVGLLSTILAMKL